MKTLVLVLFVGLLVVGAAHAFEIYVDGVKVPLSGNRLTVRMNSQESIRIRSEMGVIIVEFNVPIPISTPTIPRARRWYGPLGPSEGGKTP